LVYRTKFLGKAHLTREKISKTKIVDEHQVLSTKVEMTISVSDPYPHPTRTLQKHP
jgi:hypothetical protein